MYWSLGSGFGVRGLGLLAPNPLAAFLFCGALGELLLVFGQFHGIARVRPRLNLGASPGQRRLAFLPAGDFLGDRQPLAQGSAVGRFGLGQKLLNLQFQLLHHLSGPDVADGAVLAGVGLNFRSVGGHGELAELEELELLGQLQDRNEALGEQRLIFPTKGAERVVVGMGVGGEHAHRDAVVSATLNAATAEDARGVTVDKRGQKHARRILFIAGSSGVDLHLSQVEGVNRIEDEMNQVIGGHPVAHVGR